MKLLGAGLLVAAVAYAQQFEIRGSVTEPGVGGIPGIELSVERNPVPVRVQVTTDGTTLISSSLPQVVPVKVTTDARGEFRISLDQPGAYSVYPVLKRNFYPASNQELNLGRRIQLNAGNPKAEVKFLLVRAGQITGLVLDDETRQPVPDYPIPLFLRGVSEQGSPVMANAGVTNSDGRFTMSQVQPAEYVVGTRPPVKGPPGAPMFDSNSPNAGYARSFWPGGTSNPAAALPIRLGSGAIVDVGTILLQKVPLYEIRVSIPQGECPEGESVRVMLLQSGAAAPVRPPEEFHCGGEEVLRGVDLGSFTLYAVSDWQGEREGFESAVWAVAPVTIVDKNEDVKLRLERGVMLEGRITGREGMNLPKRLPIGSRPVELIEGSKPPWEQFIEWTSDTTFRMMVHPSPQELSLQNLQAPFYVKEIRYSGAPVRSDIIPVSAGAGSQTLEIIVDDKGARVSGTVVFGAAPPRPAMVVLVKSIPGSVPSIEGPDSRFTQVIVNGQFQFQAVRPGDYRIFVTPADDLPRLYTTGVLERLMAAGEKITVEAGVSQTVSLRLTEIGR